MGARQARVLIDALARTRDPQYFAPDAVLYDMPVGRPFEGREAIASLLRLFYAEAFSDAEAEVRTVALDAEQGLGFIEWTFRGRHTGDLLGIALTARRVELPILAVCEIADGLVQRGRLYYDTGTLLRQLGRPLPSDRP